jgi:GTP-binding protein
MLPIVAIIGRPNVGKSTLFNRIIEDRLSITDDLPGVTRDRIYSKATWLDKEFRLIDTGGIEISDAPFLTEIKAQAEIAIEEANVIIFAVDAKDGLLPGDKDVMAMLYSSDKPIIVAVNKVDNEKYKEAIFDFYELGADHVINVSSAHGIGIGDLLDTVVSYFPEEEDSPYEEDDILLSIIGRPNVGKSSLTNALLGYDRVIVSDVEGTTTDSVDTEFTYEDQKYVVIDTAGMKKRGKIYENLDRYANLRAMQAIDRSDVCLMILDAETGIRQLDKNIAGYAIENRKAMIVVVNKWDAIERDQYTMKEWEKNIRQEFKFLKYIPIVFVSALTKSRLKTLFPVIQEAYQNYNKRVSTSLLNETIQEALLLNPPKPVRQKTIKVYYATQVKTKCPTFILFVNDTEAMHFSYKRYIENKLREKFDFFGTPIGIILRKRT